MATQDEEDQSPTTSPGAGPTQDNPAQVAPPSSELEPMEQLLARLVMRPDLDLGEVAVALVAMALSGRLRVETESSAWSYLSGSYDD